MRYPYFIGGYANQTHKHTTLMRTYPLAVTLQPYYVTPMIHPYHKHVILNQAIIHPLTAKEPKINKERGGREANLGVLWVWGVFTCG